MPRAPILPDSSLTLGMTRRFSTDIARHVCEMTDTMRAVAIDRFGGPEVLVVHELPVLKIAPQEVLIAIDTAGVGIWDAKARDGAWAESDRFPLILGIDGSGVV